MTACSQLTTASPAVLLILPTVQKEYSTDITAHFVLLKPANTTKQQSKKSCNLSNTHETFRI